MVVLTPLRALHAETSGNCQQGNRLRYADSATYSNPWKQVSADCGSEGRGFESRRSPSYWQLRRQDPSNPNRFDETDRAGWSASPCRDEPRLGCQQRCLPYAKTLGTSIFSMDCATFPPTP